MGGIAEPDLQKITNTRATAAALQRHRRCDQVLRNVQNGSNVRVVVEVGSSGVMARFSRAL